MSYNYFTIGIQFAYFALGIITATIIGSVACGVWLFLNKGTAKFCVRDAMKYLRLIMVCFIAPIIPFVFYAVTIKVTNIRSIPLARSMVYLLLYVLAIWLFFVIVVVLLRLKNYYRVCKLCRDNIPIEDEDILEEVEYWKQQLSIRRKVNIYLNGNISSPAIVYYWGYKILLPAYEMTSQEICMAILHELVHLKHKDILSKDMCFAVNLLHGFNPITLWTKNHLVKWAEVLCDIETCEVGREHFTHNEYYYGILHLMKNATEEINDSMFCLVEKKSILKFRINMYAELGEKEQKRLGGVFYFMIVFMLLVTLSVFTITTKVTSAVFEETIVEVEEQQNMNLVRITKPMKELFMDVQVLYGDAIVDDDKKDLEFYIEGNTIKVLPIEVSKNQILDLYVFCEKGCILGYINKDGTATYVEGTKMLLLNVNLIHEIEAVFVKNTEGEQQFVEWSYVTRNNY